MVETCWNPANHGMGPCGRPTEFTPSASLRRWGFPSVTRGEVVFLFWSPWLKEDFHGLEWGVERFFFLVLTDLFRWFLIFNWLTIWLWERLIFGWTKSSTFLFKWAIHPGRSRKQIKTEHLGIKLTNDNKKPQTLVFQLYYFWFSFRAWDHHASWQPMFFQDSKLATRAARET